MNTATATGSDTTTIAQATPAIVTQVSAAGVQNGTSFTDTATLSGLVNPVQGPGAGSVTYSVFGPNDPTCAGPDLYTGADDVVTGNGDYTSDPFTAPGPGTYFWVVSYTGDLNNAPVSSPCGAPNENVRVIDIDIDKTVAPASQPAPTGTFTYTIVVTNPTPFPLTINTLDDDVYGNIGTEAIEAGDPVITGNTCDDLIGDVIPPNSSTAPCTFTGTFTGLPGDTETDIATVVVTDEVTGATATASDDAVVTLTTPPPPAIAVDKTASPLQREVPGGDFTFTVVVTNTGPIPITITSLDDDIYGNIGTEAIEAGDVAITANTCDDLIGDNLAPGESSAPCSFTGPFNSAVPASQTDIVTVVGTDFIGRTATDSDDATVTLVLPPPPTIAVDKTASPLQQQAPGGTFTFTVVVTNTGPDPDHYHQPGRRHLRQHRHRGDRGRRRGHHRQHLRRPHRRRPGARSKLRSVLVRRPVQQRRPREPDRHRYGGGNRRLRPYGNRLRRRNRHFDPPAAAADSGQQDRDPTDSLRLRVETSPSTSRSPTRARARSRSPPWTTTSTATSAHRRPPAPVTT